MKKLTINLFAFVLVFGAITPVSAPTVEEFKAAFVAEGGSVEMATKAFLWLQTFELVEKSGDSFSIPAAVNATLLNECIRTSSKLYGGGFDSQSHLKNAFMPMLDASQTGVSQTSRSSSGELSIVPEE